MTLIMMEANSVPRAIDRGKLEAQIPRRHCLCFCSSAIASGRSIIIMQGRSRPAERGGIGAYIQSACCHMHSRWACWANLFKPGYLRRKRKYDDATAEPCLGILGIPVLLSLQPAAPAEELGQGWTRGQRYRTIALYACRMVRLCVTRRCHSLRHEGSALYLYNSVSVCLSASLLGGSKPRPLYNAYVSYHPLLTVRPCSLQLCLYLHFGSVKLARRSIPLSEHTHTS